MYSWALETTRGYHRLLHLPSLPGGIHGLRFVCFRVENNHSLISPKHMLFKVIVSTFTNRLGAFPSFTTPFLRFSWFICGLSFSAFVRHGFVVCFFQSDSSLKLIYGAILVLTLISFIRRQAQFSQFLSTNSSLTASRYFRLMALACTEILCTTPLAIFQITLNATAAPIMPWVSWEDTHYGFDRVGQIPAVIWRGSHLVVAGLTLTKWSSVICAFIFFIFFGFAAEARRHYSGAFIKLLLVCRLKKPASSIDEKSGYVNDSSSLIVSPLIIR